jgi:hypothetical protein
MLSSWLFVVGDPVCLLQCVRACLAVCLFSCLLAGVQCDDVDLLDCLLPTRLVNDAAGILFEL